ncbi:DUF6334 family protein [Acinetobacter sp. VNK23]|uniref:DUF6334 family protein n=1 Tax=Acinetobacter thutiue TaxID=2998078 RepID=UPI002574DAF4|nr:DUF6334 family protein [Acinetobacter thutiue]MDM1018774.1 DUF6334 family protein [Acinetobacter thutiue]
MVESDIFEIIKNNNEIRKIDDIYFILNDEEDNSLEVRNIIFKINNRFWIIRVNHGFDEIELLIYSNLEANFINGKRLDILSNLKGMEISTIFAIVNERGYTDGLKLRINDFSLSRYGNSSFYGIFTIIAMSSGLKYELTQTGIEEYLV